MKINLKVRMKNKVFVTTMTTTVVAFVYQICGLLGVVPSMTESEVMNIIYQVITLLALLGILVDPTTQGIGDSARVLEREE